MSKEPSHLVKFRSKLHKDEVITTFMVGYVGSILGSGSDKLVNGVLILTNQRVVFFSKSMFGEVQESIAIEKISSVDTGTVGMVQAIRVYTSGNRLEFKGPMTPAVNELVDEILRCMKAIKKETGPAALSIADELMKLAELKNAGILTEEEFSKAKAKLVA